MKTAIVSGASSGIGKAITGALEESNWQVVGLSSKEVDLADLQKTSEFAEKLASEHTSIDAVIHVAGIWHDKKNVYANRDLEDFTPAQIIETINVGLTSFMILTAKLLPKIPKDGTVIGISGTFGDGAAGWLPYYTSKRGLEDFLVGLAQDYPKGPKVFGISPADTATAAYKKFYAEYATDAQSPEVVAKLCLELLLERPKYKSGDIIEIRGGKTQIGFHV